MATPKCSNHRPHLKQGVGLGEVPNQINYRGPLLGRGQANQIGCTSRRGGTDIKRSTHLEGQTAVDQLWACASDELTRSVYDSGVSDNCTEADLLQSMRKLTVRVQNTLVNVVTFLGMSQDSEETAGSFAARLRGQGAICDFSIKCTSTTCQKENSYMDNMISHQLVRGLADTEIQEQVLSHAATTTGLNLASIMKFIEAKETGKRSTAQI